MSCASIARVKKPSRGKCRFLQAGRVQEILGRSWVPSGKHTKHYRKSPFYSWENPLFPWSFSIAMLVCQRVYLCSFGILWDVPQYDSLSICRISLYVHPKQKLSEMQKCMDIMRKQLGGSGPTASKNKANQDEPSCVLHQFWPIGHAQILVQLFPTASDPVFELSVAYTLGI